MAIEALDLKAAEEELVTTRIELADSRSEKKRLDDQLLQYLQVTLMGFWWFICKLLVKHFLKSCV